MSMVEHGVQEAGTGNALFSPVSILITLNMLLLGTQGDTRTELLTALGNTLHTPALSPHQPPPAQATRATPRMSTPSSRPSSGA